MKVKNLNNSSLKTKKLIKKTFATLINEKKELSKLSVSELVTRADINRGTFYNHYNSIYDVAEDFESEVIKLLFEDNKELNSVQEIYLYIDNIINYLKSNEDLYKMLLASKEPMLFLEKLDNLIYKKLSKSLSSLSNIKNKNDLEINVSFYVSGAVNQILKYFRGQLDISLNELGQYMKNWLSDIFLKQ